MSNFALTIPGKWSSFNTSTVQHPMARHSSFRSPRTENIRTGKLNQSNKEMDEINEKFPLLYLSDGETRKDKELHTGSEYLPQLVGKQSVLNKTGVSQRWRDDKDRANIGSVDTNVSMFALSDTLYTCRIRLKKLESEKQDMQKQINALYKENKSLRMSVDSADKPGIDSYRQALDDRQQLREAEDNYKKRISKLEKDAKETLKEIQNLKDENKKLKDGSPKHKEQLESQSKYNNLYWKWNALKKENEKLQRELEIETKLGSQSNVRIVLGRGFNQPGSTGLQFNSVYEERNTLKIENKKLKEENEKLSKQKQQRRDEHESQNVDQSLGISEEMSNTNSYQKLYDESDKKSQLYKRIMQLEHENTYLSVSNNNLLRELRDLQAKYHV